MFIVKRLLISFWMGLILLGACQRQGFQDRPAAGTLGSVANVVYPAQIELEGYGLVGGLPGTGSPECPGNVRRYLVHYAQSQAAGVDIDRLLNSYQTAVVYIQAKVSGLTRMAELFDVKVTALGQLPSINLDGGWLYTAELFPKGTSATPLRPTATAQGPIYIDRLSQPGPDTRTGYVPGGGRLLILPSILVFLNKEDFRLASAIRDLVNDRFGLDCAKAISPRQIALKVPARYAFQANRFISVLQALPLDQQAVEQLGPLVERLKGRPDDTHCQAQIEAIGPAAIGLLRPLLDSADPKVRLAAARCLSNLGSPDGIAALVGIAYNPRSQDRLQAIEALACTGPTKEVTEALKGLLVTDDLKVAFAAYQQLLRIDPTALPAQKVSDYVLLDQFPSCPRPGIAALRSRCTRVGLFGQVQLRKGVSIRYGDNLLVIDARSDPTYLLVSRFDPSSKVWLEPVKCSYKITDLIVLLLGKGREGLGFSYSDLLGILKKACDSGLIAADFWVGPAPE